jgi:hypothetical protein
LIKLIPKSTCVNNAGLGAQDGATTIRDRFIDTPIFVGRACIGDGNIPNVTSELG